MYVFFVCMTVHVLLCVHMSVYLSVYVYVCVHVALSLSSLSLYFLFDSQNGYPSSSGKRGSSFDLCLCGVYFGKLAL